MSGWTRIKNGGERVWIENRIRSHARCRYCGAIIFWGVSQRNRYIALVKDIDGEFKLHRPECPGPAGSKKPQGEGNAFMEKTQGV